MMYKIVSKAALYAEVAVVGHRAYLRSYLYQFTGLLVDVEEQVAADTAVAAHGLHLIQLPVSSLSLGLLLSEGAYGACRDTLPAELAACAEQGLAVCRTYHRLEAAVYKVQGVGLLHLVAYPDAASAEYALGIVPQYHGVRVGDDAPIGLFEETAALKVVLVGKVLEDAAAAFIAGHAVQGMVRQDKLQRKPPGLVDLRGVGFDYHAVLNQGGACGCKRLSCVLHLYHTDPACAERFKSRVVAQGGYPYAERVCCLEYGLVGTCLNLPAVNGELYFFYWFWSRFQPSCFLYHQ